MHWHIDFVSIPVPEINPFKGLSVFRRVLCDYFDVIQIREIVFGLFNKFNNVELVGVRKSRQLAAK